MKQFQHSVQDGPLGSQKQETHVASPSRTEQSLAPALCRTCFMPCNKTALECILFSILFNSSSSSCTIPSVSQPASEAQRCSAFLGAVWADIEQISLLYLKNLQAVNFSLLLIWGDWLLGFHIDLQKPGLPGTPAEKTENQWKMAKPMEFLTVSN